jgi:hypothetical protein
VVTFDQVAGVVASLDAAIDSASPEQLKELVKMLVQRVTTQQRAFASVQIVPAALPFFAPPTLLVAPPDGLEPQSGKALDPLGWYAGRSPTPAPASPIAR